MGQCTLIQLLMSLIEKAGISQLKRADIVICLEESKKYCIIMVHNLKYQGE
jgi:hypothetical protein